LIADFDVDVRFREPISDSWIDQESEIARHRSPAMAIANRPIDDHHPSTNQSR